VVQKLQNQAAWSQFSFTATEKNLSGTAIILKESAVFILGQQVDAAHTFKRVNFYQTT
jgi:hypothetical protein